jgi:hypothetical protein
MLTKSSVCTSFVEYFFIHVLSRSFPHECENFIWVSDLVSNHSNDAM